MVYGSADAAVLLVALSFAAMGIVALLRPASIGSYFQTAITSIDGRNEIRAVYGGFGLAMGIGLIVALQDRALRDGIVACVALALAGMALGRLLSAALERPGRWPWIFFAIEVVAAGALGITHFA